MILPAILTLLASAAAVVAAGEHRTRDMAVAAGIAAALSPAGLVLLPVLLGTAIARGVAGAALAAFAASLLVTLAAAGHVPALVDISAWQFAGELRGLLLALAAGGAAWLAAACAARRLAPREFLGAALLAALVAPLLLPIGAETLVLALALAITGARPRLPVTGANDNPLPLHATA